MKLKLQCKIIQCLVDEFRRIKSRIKKIYKIEGLYMLMKKGVLIFGLLFVSLMIVLIFARFSIVDKANGVTGNVIQENYNPVFSWRDFNLEIKNISNNRDSVDVSYGLREFTNNPQPIDVSFYFAEKGKDLKYAGKETVVVSANSETIYTKRFSIPLSGEYNINLEATNGRKITSDGREFMFTRSVISGNVIQEVRESNSKNIILLVLIIILVIILIIELKKKRKVVEHYKSKHNSRFISLDLK